MNRISTLLATAMVAASLPAAAGEPGDLGPEVAGLRLGLRIETTRASGDDAHHATLRIVNVSQAPITLSADWDDEGATGSFDEWVVQDALVTTLPAWPTLTAQTAGGVERRSPQPTVTVPPGESHEVAWTGIGRRLKPESCYNTYPDLHDAGLYAATVHLRVNVGDGPQVLLHSNPVQVSVGGSVAQPRTGLTRVRHYDAREKLVCLAAGSDDGIRVGDRIRVAESLVSGWELKVLRVQEQYAWCSIFDVHGNPLSPEPPVGSEATLIAPDPPAPTPASAAP